MNTQANFLSQGPDFFQDDIDANIIQVLPSDAWTQTLERRSEVPLPLWETVIARSHNTPSAGHPGIHKTKELIKKEFYWTGMDTNIKSYVKGCEICQRMKPNQQRHQAPLIPHAVPEGPWDMMSWDLTGPLTKSNGFDAILVIVDKFLKYTLLEPINMMLNMLGAAKILLNWVYRHFGMPRKSISD